MLVEWQIQRSLRKERTKIPPLHCLNEVVYYDRDKADACQHDYEEVIHQEEVWETLSSHSKPGVTWHLHDYQETQTRESTGARHDHEQDDQGTEERPLHKHTIEIHYNGIVDRPVKWEVQVLKRLVRL